MRRGEGEGEGWRLLLSLTMTVLGYIQMVPRPFASLESNKYQISLASPSFQPSRISPEIISITETLLHHLSLPIVPV